MMKNFRTLINILVVLPALFVGRPAYGAESASSVMARCAAKVSRAPSVSASFYLSAGGERYDCSMTMSKQKFVMSTPQMKVFYDGTTQWTYAVASQELSITEPTAAELLESNPFAILNHYAKAYSCRLLAKENGMTRVELVAKADGAAVRKAVVSVDPRTDLPAKLIVTLGNGRVVAATVTSISIGKECGASAFVFDKSKYPVSEIIDLR